MESPNIVIEVNGGVVQQVYCDRPDMVIVLIDTDTEHCDREDDSRYCAAEDAFIVELAADTPPDQLGEATLENVRKHLGWDDSSH